MKRTEVIKELIDKRNLTLKAFSKEANIPYTTLYSILQKNLGNTSLDNVIKICRALNITIEELHELADVEYIQKTKLKPLIHMTDEEIKQLLEEELDKKGTIL